jgi:hypothetical protein
MGCANPKAPLPNKVAATSPTALDSIAGGGHEKAQSWCSAKLQATDPWKRVEMV